MSGKKSFLKYADELQLKKHVLSIAIVSILLLSSFLGMFHISVDTVQAMDDVSDSTQEIRQGIMSDTDHETRQLEAVSPTEFGGSHAQMIVDDSSGIPEGLSKSEWNSITDQIQTAQYYPTWHETSHAYVVSNPEHDFRIAFDDGNACISSLLKDDWSVRLIPSGYGYEDHISSFDIDPQVILEGNRIEYCYNDYITGWYVNDETGLEHGFNINSPPERLCDSDLRIEMKYDTLLHPLILDDAIVFTDASGDTVLHYGKLLVTDAAGSVLPSCLILDEKTDTITLSIDDSDAVYPIVVDPLVTSFVKKITAADGAPNDYFGWSVSISGDTIVVGAYGDDSSRGAAYVFTRNNQSADDWGQVAKLTASDGEANDRFGWSVSISFDTIVVGAHYNDDIATNAGAAYVFVRNNQSADDWGQVAKLTASDGAIWDWFGYSVSISCDTCVIGKPYDAHEGWGSGAAYVFVRNNESMDDWGQVAKLTASDSAVSDLFGWSVSISGDTIVVGAYGDDSSRGAAYVFTRNNQSADDWGQVAKLTAADGADGDEFGRSVSISYDTIVVGAYYSDGYRGSAYVFVRNNESMDDWGQVAKLTASDGAEYDYFGYSVSISGDTIVVGANGDDDKGSYSGSVYVFVRNNQSADDWGQLAKLNVSDGVADDNFGYSVSISGDTLVAGAIGANSYKGAAYIYVTEGDAWTQISKPVAEDGARWDLFGCSVSISCDTIVVGAYADDGYMGAAYVFVRNNESMDDWGQVVKLTAADGASCDGFGCSVSISGDTIVVGAYGKDNNAGAAYVFVRNNESMDDWGQVKKLTASNGEEDDYFGWSASISCDTIVVGAYGAYSYSEEGRAYVFTRNEGGADMWGQVVILHASDGCSGDYFGCSVSISCDTIVVGAYGADSEEGAAYVFTRNQDGADWWGQVTKLTAADGVADDEFGCSVSISGDTIVVGAYGDNSSRGAAYVFTRNEGGADMWGQVTKLTASDGADGDYFGCSVSISCDTIVVGARYGDGYNGTAYVFTRNQGGVDRWGQVTNLTADDGEPGYGFGCSVSICCDTIVVGADRGNGEVDTSGAAYVFYNYSINQPVDPPSNVHAATNSSSEIYLTWTKATGADTTCIQQKTGSYPTSVTDGTTVYNSSGSQYSDTGLTEGTTYYYRAWSYNVTDGEWSSSNASATNTTNTLPTITTPGPSNQSTGIGLSPLMNITINDADGDTMVLNWYSNSSGSYVLFGTNNSCTNGTYHQTNTNFSSYYTTYYWYVTVNDSKDTNTSPVYYFTTEIGSPTVTTNTSTGVEETNATLQGYLSSDGGMSCTVRFSYGTTTDYGTNTSNQTKNTQESITEHINNLSPGQLYHYQTYANNTVGSDTGSDQTFLTKPQPPTNLQAQTNSSSIIYLTWTNGTGTNNTYIERNTAANWAKGAGTTIYNGSIPHYEDTGLSEATMYYYQAWSYTTWSSLHQFSDENASVSGRTNTPPTIEHAYPDNCSNVTLRPLMNVTISDRDGQNMTIYWYTNESGSWEIFAVNNTCTNGTYFQSYNNFSAYNTTYFWNVSVTDGISMNTSSIYRFSTMNRGSGDFLNEWTSSVTPTYIMNNTETLFNFTIVALMSDLTVDNVTINLPEGFIYTGANGTTVSTNYTVTNTTQSVTWEKSNQQGFAFDSSEHFWFNASSNASLGGSSFRITANHSYLGQQNITMQVYTTTSFYYTGSIKNRTGQPLVGATGMLTVQAFSMDGPPTTIGEFTANTNATGYFNITIIPCVEDYSAINCSNTSMGPGSMSALMYQLSGLQYNDRSDLYATNISTTLPQIPLSELKCMLQDPEMYLYPALSFNVTAIGPQFEWNQTTQSVEITNYSAKSFELHVKDLKLGFPVKEYGTQAYRRIFSVPKLRNYSLNIFPDQSFPVNIRFYNITSVCENATPGADNIFGIDGVNTSCTAYNGTYLINVTINTSYAAEYINGAFNNITDPLTMQIVSYNMESSDMVFEDWALPINIALEQNRSAAEDAYNLTTKTFNISLPATYAPSYLMLRAYAQNATGYYMGSYIIYCSNGTFNVSTMNFTMQRLRNGTVTRSISTNDVANQWNTTTVVNTTAILFNLVSSNGTLLSDQNPFIEIKRELGSSEYMYMANAQNGQFNVSVPVGAGFKKLNIYSQQYAPVSAVVLPAMLNGTYSNSIINCSIINGSAICNVTLRSFGSFDPLGENTTMMMDMYLCNTSCNIPNPPRQYSLCPETNQSNFSPLNAVLKGDINLMIKTNTSTGNISVYYINVDLLACGPPDAAFSTNGTETDGGLDTAWQFGSQGPDIYSYVLIGIPYNSSYDNNTLKVTIPKLYDNDFNVIWNESNGDNITTIRNSAVLYELYGDFLNTSYEAYLNGTGVLCNASDPTLSTGLGYKDVTNHTIWIKVLHFSGLGPTVIVEPNPPRNLTATTYNSTRINLSWTKADDADRTRIQQKTSGYPQNTTDGTNIYNGTGSTCFNTSLQGNTTYYFRAWSWNETNHQWSSSYDSAYNTTKSKPTISNEGPSNQSTGILPLAQMNITISDPDGSTMTLVWYSNSSGSWTEFGRNTSCSNGTYHQTNSNFTNKSTKYYWNVSVADGTDTNTSAIYHFTVTNANAVISNPSPANQSTGVSRTPTLQVTVTDTNNDTMNVTWYSNSSGTWASFATDTNVTSGNTIQQGNANFSGYETMYYWSVNVTDGTNYTNATYHFTTESTTPPKPPQPPIPVPPVADAGGPYSSLEDSIVTFDGSGSYDSDGTITNYTWLLDGSVLLYGETTTYEFSQAGNYTLMLTVTDADDLTDNNSTTVTITARPPDVHKPVPILNGPYRAIINETITLDASQSYDPDGGSITNYSWYLGDGTIAYGAVTTHSYLSSGNYSIMLYIEDSGNLTNSTATYAYIYQGTPVKPLDGDLIDTNDSGTYDYYYNKTSGTITKTKELQNGSYLIDDTGDGQWNWIYDPVTGNLSKYHEIPPTPKNEFPWIYLAVTLVVVIAAIYIAVLYTKKKP